MLKVVSVINVVCEFNKLTVVQSIIRALSEARYVELLAT